MNRFFVLFLLGLFILTASSAIAAENETAAKESLDKGNPVQLTEKVLLKGKGTYFQLCARCHGDDGRGNKISLEWWLGNKPDLASAAKAQSDTELFNTILNGKGIMTGFSKTLMDNDIYNVIHFLKNIDTIKK